MADLFRKSSGHSGSRFNSVAPILKMRLENELVRKREAESRRSETWRSNDQYFQKWNVQNEKFDDWTSSRSAQLSHRQHALKESLAEVESRREKLRELYKEDNLRYEAELKQLEAAKEEEKWNLIKNKVEHFRQTKQLQLRDHIEKNEHEKWKSTSASFRAFESELRTQQIQEALLRQRMEKEEQNMLETEEKEKERKKMEQLQEEHKRRLEDERRIEVEKKREWKKGLDQQIHILRERDAEAFAKQSEEERLMLENQALEAAKKELLRKEHERAEKRKMGIFLAKQHSAKLRLRSREVAAEIDAEQFFLNKLFPPGDEMERKQALRQDLEQFRKLVEHHRQLEEQRQSQMEVLFQEEAQRMWEKREREWEMERLARKKLMEDVISTQQRQVQERINVAQLEKERLLKDREAIAESLAAYSDEMKWRDLKRLEQKREMKSELANQMELKRRTREEELTKDREEFTKAQQEEMLRNEKHWAIAMERLKL